MTMKRPQIPLLFKEGLGRFRQPRPANGGPFGVTGFPSNIDTTSKGVRHDRCICNVSLRRQFR